MANDSASSSKCGTYAGAAQHRRWGQPLCAACRDAYNEYHRRWEGQHPEHHQPVRKVRVNLCLMCGRPLFEHPMFGRCWRQAVGL